MKQSRMSRHLALSTLAAALLATWGAPVLAAPPLACGTLVTQSISLNQDLVCPSGFSGPALEIGDHFVGIDLNGFTIQGPGSATPTQGIRSVGFDGVSITGGNVRDFGTAMYIEGGTSHYISKVTANEPFSVSLFLNSVSDSYVGRSRLRTLDLMAPFPLSARNNVVERNRFGSAYAVEGDGGRVIVAGCETSGNRIDSNTLDTTDRYQPAVLFTFGANANSFNGNDVHGSVMLQNAPRNTLRDNSITSASEYAIRLESYPAQLPCSKSATLTRDNVVTENDIDGGASGIVLGEPVKANGYNTVISNLVGGNRISNVPGTGLFFNLSAVRNDGRGNSYSNVGTDVADHIGSRNLWP